MALFPVPRGADISIPATWGMTDVKAKRGTDKRLPVREAVLGRA